MISHRRRREREGYREREERHRECDRDIERMGRERQCHYYTRVEMWGKDSVLPIPYMFSQ